MLFIAPDQAPAQTEIAIVRRQAHYTMQMLRQHHPCVNAKRVPFTHPSHRIAQQIDFPHQQIIAAALQQVHRKEPGAARYKCTPVLACPYSVIYSCVRLRYANLRVLTLPGVGQMKVRLPRSAILRHLAVADHTPPAVQNGYSASLGKT